MFDCDGNPKYVNDAYLRLIGLEREVFEQAASRGLAWQDTIYEEDIDLATDIWARIRDSKTPFTSEYRVKVAPTKPGEKPGVRALETISFPEVDESGRVVTVQGWLIDVSPRKRLETLMAQRLEDALETRRASENFIDMVSHEMRNPLSAILQLADGILGSLETTTTQNAVTLPADTINMMVDAAETIVSCAATTANASILTINTDTLCSTSEMHCKSDESSSSRNHSCIAIMRTSDSIGSTLLIAYS